MLGFGILLAGCNQQVDKISDINDNPSKYLNQNVTLAGTVTQVYGLPLGLSNIAAYKLDDGTGSIWVVTHDGAPEKGAKLGIKGTVKPAGESLPSEATAFINQLIGNIVDETQRRLA